MPKVTVTIKDVAFRAGVSASTVSNVMLGRNAATPGVADRVREAAQDLGYVANRSASQLRSGKARIITVLVPNLTDPFFAAVIAQLEQLAQVEGFDIIVASSNADEDVERTRLAALLSWRPSGVMVVPHRDDFPNRAMLDELRLPYVVIDRAASNLVADAVVTANHAATAEAAAHLLDNGHRDILVVTSTFRLENIRQRYEGVADCFTERGLPAPPALQVGLTFETVADRLGGWLVKNKRPTAFLAVTNFVTMGVLGYLKQAGLSVPKDVSLVGYDDYPWMEASSPAITAIRQDVAALAAETWTLLRRRIAGDAAPPQRATVPCRLVLRDSVHAIGLAVACRPEASAGRSNEIFSVPFRNGGPDGPEADAMPERRFEAMNRLGEVP